MNTIKSIIKVDVNTIAVVKETKEIPIVPAKQLDPVLYEYSFLVKQKKDIQTQWDEMIAQKNKEIEDINTARQAELDEVNELLGEADKIGVVAKAKINEEPLEP